MTDLIQHNGYYGEVHFSVEDEVFYGKLIGINDLVTFEGASVRELKEAFREAVEDYLETCRQLNKQPDKTYKGSFNVRVSAELHKQAALYAAVKNMSLNDFVKYALQYTLTHS